jgi:hypothetical protein
MRARNRRPEVWLRAEAAGVSHLPSLSPSDRRQRPPAMSRGRRPGAAAGAGARRQRLTNIGAMPRSSCRCWCCWSTGSARRWVGAGAEALPPRCRLLLRGLCDWDTCVAHVLVTAPRRKRGGAGGSGEGCGIGRDGAAEGVVRRLELLGFRPALPPPAAVRAQRTVQGLRPHPDPRLCSCCCAHRNFCWLLRRLFRAEPAQLLRRP